MRSTERTRVWPRSLRGRFTAVLMLASSLLFIIVFAFTSLISGYGLWPAEPGAVTGAYTPLIVGGLTLLVGLALAHMLARAIRRPIERSIEYVRQRGIAAIEGRSSEDMCAPDIDLPIELEELCTTVEELLRQLSLRQADLRAVTEQALDSEQTFRTVVNASSEAKLLLRGGVIEVANPSAAAILRLPQGYLLGIPLRDALSGIAVMTESGEPVTAETLLMLPDDEVLAVQSMAEGREDRWAECSVSRPKEDSELLLLTIRDVTERHQLERLRTEVVSVVSHDLRAPLTVVSGYLDMLGNDALAPRRDEILTNARAATARMASMLEDLLDAARSSRGIASVRFAPVDLGALTAEVIAGLPAHPDHELSLEQHAEVTVSGDAERLRQAFTNLLMNAIQHTPEGTRIVMQVTSEKDHAMVIVEDEGSGVPEAQRESIFDRYVRLDDDSADGTGLGLYIVKTIVESHGGRAYVEDSAEGGARFVVEIPLLTAGLN